MYISKSAYNRQIERLHEKLTRFIIDFIILHCINKYDDYTLVPKYGYRLPPPPGCSRPIYEVMIQCWRDQTLTNHTSHLFPY